MSSHLDEIASSIEKRIAVATGATLGGVTWHNMLATVNLAHITIDQVITTSVLTFIGMSISAVGTFFLHKLLTFFWNWAVAKDKEDSKKIK